MRDSAQDPCPFGKDEWLFPLLLRLWTGPGRPQLRQDRVPAARERPPEGARASSVAAGRPRSRLRRLTVPTREDSRRDGQREGPRLPASLSPSHASLSRGRGVSAEAKWSGGWRAPASPRGRVHASGVQSQGFPMAGSDLDLVVPRVCLAVREELGLPWCLIRAPHPERWVCSRLAAGASWGGHLLPPPAWSSHWVGGRHCAPTLPPQAVPPELHARGLLQAEVSCGCFRADVCHPCPEAQAGLGQGSPEPVGADRGAVLRGRARVKSACPPPRPSRADPQGGRCR